MKGIYKYIGAGVGFYISGFRFFGLFIGFFIGSLIDGARTAENSEGKGRNYRYNNDIFNYYQRQTQRYDFPTALLALSAVVMKADGRAMKSELDYVKNFLNQQFGNQFTVSHLQTLKVFLSQSNTLPILQICQDIRSRTTPEVRVQLLHYLFGIAKADGEVSLYEANVLNQIANYLGIPNMDFTSVKNMFQRDTESDYKILGISKDSSVEEIKKAYRKMAIRYHPDKVASMGEEYQKGATEKFLKIQEAYENIKKEKNFA